MKVKGDPGVVIQIGRFVLCFVVAISLVLSEYALWTYPYPSGLLPLALGQCDCLCASEVTLKDVGKIQSYRTRINHEQRV